MLSDPKPCNAAVRTQEENLISVLIVILIGALVFNATNALGSESDSSSQICSDKIMTFEDWVIGVQYTYLLSFL